MDTPRNLKLAAGLQIASGVINILLMAGLSWCTVSTVCAGMSLLIGGIGWFCGLAGLLLVPLGLIEIGAGVYGWMEPREGSQAMRFVSYLEMGSIFLGGLGSLVVGFVVAILLNTDEVAAYLRP